ncbi:MFS transporter [Corynebacterium pseudodiphtheriticum]|uniref:MFS transporter n=1 Tax=Corynebacterium pseudodiphtheriticum TaxID=37637 RepID=UPI00234D910B|nr:MFS transporter [Corynebacterium pseudodiphtheriticum]MDC7067850.1 MFS transporter [Corynebacterium pseudodiphtheriticum]MDC7084082.1 MFS transporter [Corynebacterium pseudodiphtheriticum]MDC7086367.1 MFS transporter [Corynebacterium pseudodiphtheriticum]
MAQTVPACGLQRGERNYRLATVAVLAAGLAVFNGLYVTQAMLPALVDAFDTTPTVAALTVSVATGMLAICVVPASILSERFGRNRVLIISAIAASLIGLTLPLAQTIHQLIALRLLHGAFIAGTPAVAMAWLAEELDHRFLARAMGVYVAGNSVGGLTGRLIPSMLLEVTDWRVAILCASLLALGFAIIVALTLPRQQFFQPKALRFRTEYESMVTHWKTPSLAAMFLIAFLAMGVFVSLYNFLAFRLIGYFELSPGIVALAFLAYLSGTYSAARAGVLAERFSRGTVLVFSTTAFIIGLLLTATPWLWLTLTGLLIFTASFFAAHSIASGWVGAIAEHNRAEASSMYVLCYYLGSSVVGALSGLVFTALPWWGFVGTLALLAGVMLALGIFAHAKEQSNDDAA